MTLHWLTNTDAYNNLTEQEAITGLVELSTDPSRSTMSFDKAVKFASKKLSMNFFELYGKILAEIIEKHLRESENEEVS